MKQNITKLPFIVVIVFLQGMGILWPQISLADDPEARRIMTLVDARDDGDNRTADLEMILIDKNGNRRIRRISSFSKDKGDDNLSLMFFRYPADLKETAFLTHDYDKPERDDDQWLFLPALRKTKRIATSDKSGSFMGSDLNYADMTTRELTNYNYSFYEKGREKEFENVKTWVIWCHPRSKKVIKETGYEKSLVFVRQDNYVVIRSISWVEHGGPLKYMMVKKLDRIDGIWVPVEMHISQKLGKETFHQTLLKFTNVKFNQNLDEKMFTVRRMEKGF